MELIKSYALEYKYLIVVAVIFIAYIIYLLVTHKFKEKALGLMLQAERLCKDKILASGQAQEDWVYEKLKVFFPKYVGLLGEVKTRALIKYLFKTAKDYLDDKKINNSTET